MKNEKLHALLDKLVDLKAREAVAYEVAVRENNDAPCSDDNLAAYHKWEAKVDRLWSRRNRLVNQICETQERFYKAVEKASKATV